MYKQIVRPVLFCWEPEKMHELLVSALKFYRHLTFVRFIISRWFQHSDPFSWDGIIFRNRIGLSAGFDKSGEVFDELADFGFGFLELGTITPEAQTGNPSPRIFRLPECDSLISRTGFNNAGLEVFRQNLKRRKGDYVVGVNINKNPLSEGETALNDFFSLFKALYYDVDYFTLNWGSVDGNLFEKVLNALTSYKKLQMQKRPVFIKLPADIEKETLDIVLSMAGHYSVDGFIATGPTMNRSLLKSYDLKELDSIGAGGVSGRGIGEKSLNVVRYLRTHANEQLLIIGAGGIMTSSDAKKMIEAGADFIQLYSAFIYSGPSIIKKMSRKIQKRSRYK